MQSGFTSGNPHLSYLAKQTQLCVSWSFSLGFPHGVLYDRTAAKQLLKDAEMGVPKRNLLCCNQDNHHLF